METPAEIAATLFQLFVEDDSAVTRPETYHVPPQVASHFRARMRQYREATVLLALVKQADKGETHERLLVEFERLILPPSQTPEGLSRADELKATMKDIFRLVDPVGEKRPMSWAINWFKQIGHCDGLNPVDLAQFSMSMMDYCIAAFNAAAICCPAEFTEEESTAIDRALNRLADWACEDGPEGTHGLSPNRIKDGIIAIGLIEYVAELCVQQKACATRGDWIAVIDKAIKAQRKAYAHHNFPAYLFEVARLFDFVGDRENARVNYAAFLEAQSRFKPDQTDILLLGLLKSLSNSHIDYDVSDEAITAKMVAFAQSNCR